MQVLLDSGDDPALGLIEAICYHRTDIVRILLESGAISNVNVNTGSALQGACESGHLDIMKVLLDGGVDPLTCNGDCIKLACRKGTIYASMSQQQLLILLVL